MLLNEVDTAAHYHITLERWFEHPREERAVMIAQRQIASLMSALNDYDRGKEWKPPKDK